MHSRAAENAVLVRYVLLVKGGLPPDVEIETGSVSLGSQ